MLGVITRPFGGDLAAVENQEIRDIITSYLYKADADYGQRVGVAAEKQFQAAAADCRKVLEDVHTSAES